jgi:hypothetical protein
MKVSFPEAELTPSKIVVVPTGGNEPPPSAGSPALSPATAPVFRESRFVFNLLPEKLQPLVLYAIIAITVAAMAVFTWTIYLNNHMAMVLAFLIECFAIYALSSFVVGLNAKANQRGISISS